MADDISRTIILGHPPVPSSFGSKTAHKWLTYVFACQSARMAGSIAGL